MNLQSCTDLTHHLWRLFLFVGADVIDMTCGNGYDTLFLANEVLSTTEGSVLGIDIQKMAIDNTQELLKEKLKETLVQRVTLVQTCHSHIKKYFTTLADLIVYNLGYLPSSDKVITTKAETTLKSLKDSLTLLKIGGHLSITCYPGHLEGKEESKEIIKWASNLSRKYTVTQHFWLNRSDKAPFILLIKNQ